MANARKTVALVVGPHEEYPACATYLKRGHSLEVTSWVHPEDFGLLDRVVALRGWEHDEDARRSVFKAVAHSVPIFDFVYPTWISQITDDNALARLGVCGNEPLEVEPEQSEEPDWEWYVDPESALVIYTVAFTNG